MPIRWPAFSGEGKDISVSLSPQCVIAGLGQWEKATQDAQKAVHQGRRRVLLAFKRVAWIGPNPRASREPILIARTLRAKGPFRLPFPSFFSILLVQVGPPDVGPDPTC